MKWDEYQKITVPNILQDREQTQIECPGCGALLWRRTDIVLTTYPPKFYYECDACGWEGTGY